MARTFSRNLIYNAIKIVYDEFTALGFNSNDIHIVSSVALCLQGIDIKHKIGDLDIVIDNLPYTTSWKRGYQNLLKANGVNLLLDIIDDSERPIVPDYKQIKLNDIKVSVQSPEKVLEHKKIIVKNYQEKYIEWTLKYYKLLCHSYNNIKDKNLDDNIIKISNFISDYFNKEFVICGSYGLYLQGLNAVKPNSGFDIYFLGEHYKTLGEDPTIEIYKDILQEELNLNIELNIRSKIIEDVDESYNNILCNKKYLKVATVENIKKAIRYKYYKYDEKYHKHKKDIEILEKILNKN